MAKKQIEDIFTKEIMKEQILQKYEENNKKIKFIKYSLIPLCLVIIIGVIILNKNNILNNPTYIDKENKINLNFNKITNLEKLISDADIKTEQNYFNLLWPDILTGGITLPSDLTKTKADVIFTKDNTTDDYTNLNCYVYNYYNDTGARNIRLSFSQNNKPIRDYYFSKENTKTSNINNYELIIYQYNQVYFVEFSYQGYNFDIETNNITQEELISLLKSIIK